jgi:tRNA dimethylallyltransferase
VPERLPIGYADAAARVRGEIDDEELARRIAVAHRRYARRQVIWLRREQDVEWLRPPVDVEGLAGALRTAP